MKEASGACRGLWEIRDFLHYWPGLVALCFYPVEKNAPFAFFCSRDSLFCYPPALFPHRSRLGAPVAGCLCPQRDCGFLLWLRHIIYGHRTGGDQQTDWPRLRSVSSLSIKGFSGMFPTSWFSACEWEKNACSSQPPLQLSFLPRLLVQMFSWLTWNQLRVSSGILVWHLCALPLACKESLHQLSVFFPLPGNLPSAGWYLKSLVLWSSLMLMGTRSRFCRPATCYDTVSWAVGRPGERGGDRWGQVTQKRFKSTFPGCKD